MARYFASEQAAIDTLESDLVALEQKLDELREEQGSEGGPLEEVVDDKGKISKKAVAARLEEIADDANSGDERAALEEYSGLLDRQAEAKSPLKAAQDALEQKVAAKYGQLTEADIKVLVVDDKWLVHLATDVQSELDRVSQSVTGRIRELADRYAAPLSTLVAEVDTLAARVAEHLKKMGAKW